MKTISQSPIKEKTLRRPAQKLKQERNKKILIVGGTFFGGVLIYIGILIGLIIGILGYNGSITHCFWVISILFIVFALFALRWEKKQAFLLQKIELGIEGEVYVGQQLDEMRVNGWLILHDFQTGKGNIDHIIIAPQGVFTLETKTVSIHEDEENCIFYDCQKVWTNKRNIDSPLNQAKGEAKFLSDYINQKLTMNVFVQPIVTYPGWDYKYCGSKTLAECEVWICLTKGLGTVINSRGRSLKPDEMRRIYNFLASENRD